MKHVWAGTALMAVLLCAGILMTVCMGSLQETLSQTLTEAADSALAENWEKTDALMGNAKRQWESSRRFVASIADHELLEEAERLFSELAVYRECRLPSDYAAVCLCLARQIEEIGESQSLCWWHLL